MNIYLLSYLTALSKKVSYDTLNQEIKQQLQIFKEVVLFLLREPFR